MTAGFSTPSRLATGARVTFDGGVPPNKSLEQSAGSVLRNLID
jgi:hypothetical protein